jgi:hypothetical protein
MVLVLNLEVLLGGTQLLADPGVRPPEECLPWTIILRLALFFKIFLSAFGKYSGRWVVMSSDGGRWPKKFLSLPNDPAVAEVT